MELKSIAYIAFVFATLLAYYGLGGVKCAQSAILLCANIFFIYRACGLRSLILIALLSAFTYGMGRLIEKKRETSKKAAKVWMLVAVIAVTAFLCYFKFFKATFVLLQELFARRGVTISDLITPVGVSYYTLSMIAYLVDIYHKKYPAEKNYFYFAAFISYFPSIVEGPINMYKKVAPQFKVRHRFSADNLTRGFQRSLWGYFKKAVIADRIGLMVTAILGGGYSGPVNLLAIMLYSFQLYADFSGGIDIIMGVSKMLDIELSENFRAPLVSKSVTEFWQRWHMSLGEFMEKYIYYPVVLGKRTRTAAKKIKNSYMQKVFAATLASVVVFVIVGIWHGTGWNYVVYGCYQAFWVSTAILLAPVYKKLKEKCRIDDKSLPWRLFCIVRTFFILMIGRCFTKSADLPQAFDLIRRSVSAPSQGLTLSKLGLDRANLVVMILGIVLLIAVDVASEKGVRFGERLLEKHTALRYGVYITGIFLVLVFGIYGIEYSAASFIYGGF